MERLLSYARVARSNASSGVKPVSLDQDIKRHFPLNFAFCLPARLDQRVAGGAGSLAG
jgi:hypothetical protein